MKYLSRSILLLICLTVLFASFVVAQDNDLEIAKIKYDKQSYIIGIYWSDTEPDWTCRKIYSKLKLTKIQYFDDEEVDEVGSLIFTDSKGIRETFGITLNFSDYSEADRSNLQSFLGQGYWYKVGHFRCGAGGKSDPQVFSLEKIIEKQSKKKK